MPKDIMYVGLKPKKNDNVNNHPSREWRGQGHIVKAVPDLDAGKLIEHPDIWLDVTGWKDTRITAYVAELQEQRRQAERAARAGQDITLKSATVEELEAELKRRAAGPKVALAPPTPRDQRITPPAPDSISQEGEPSLGRPDNTEDLAAEIMGVLVQLNPESDVDGNGEPHIERVIAKLGFDVTREEVMAIWPHVKG